MIPFCAEGNETRIGSVLEDHLREGPIATVRNAHRNVLPVSYTHLLLLGCCGGLCSMLLHAAVDFNLHIPANALLFSVLAGLAWSLSAGDANAPERRAVRR